MWHYFFYCRNKISSAIEVTSPSAPLFRQKKWSASLFLQKKMRRLIIYWEKMLIFFWRNNEALHYLSEEIMRGLIFFWRNNEALDFFIAEIRLAGLWGNKTKCLIISSEKNEVPHYFFKKKELPHYCFREKWNAFISSAKNEVRCYFFRKKWGALLFLYKKIK